jgi:CRP/FNR family transcriptional regulator
MSTVDDIAKSPLFGSMPEKDMERLAEAAVSRTFSRDELIFSEGDEAEGFYLLTEGSAKIYKLSPAGKEQILHVVSAGEVFGEAAVFTGGKYPAFARALAESRTVFFLADKFRAETAANPELALHMLGAMAGYLRRFARLVEQLSLRDVPARLAEYLLNAPADGEGRMNLSTTKRELAAYLGTQPETLSRALGALQAEGLIEVDGSSIRIAEPQRLEGIANGEADS